MKKYIVSVCRTSYAFHDFEVEAKDEGEADRKAMELAGDFVFSERDAEYNIAQTVEKKGK